MTLLKMTLLKCSAQVLLLYLVLHCSGTAVPAGRCTVQMLLFYLALHFSGIAVLSDAPLSFIFHAGKAGKKKPDALKTSGP